MFLQPVKLIYLYADEDKTLVEQIRNNLFVLQKLKYIELWSRDHIESGSDRLESFKKAVVEAKIVMFFFSANFINCPDYYQISETLLPSEKTIEEDIWERYRIGQIHIVPILLNKFVGSDEFAYFKELSVLPTNKPLGSYRDRADQKNKCAEIGETVKELVKIIRTGEKKTLPPKFKMPVLPVSLLPQLCDRTEQSNELRQQFENFRNSQSPKNSKTPMVFVVHGETGECLEGFQARLERKEIYEFLRIDYEHPIQIYNLEFPYLKSDVHNPYNFFERALSERLFDDGVTRSKEELFCFISQFRIVIINYRAFSENWHESVIKAFLDFWGKTPLLNFHTTTIVNLFFSYDESIDFYKENDRKARTFFNELKQNLFFDYPEIKGIVLSELDAIERTEVVNWLHSEKVFREFCVRHTPSFCDNLSAMNKINDLYGDRKTPRRLEREIKILDSSQTQKKIFIRMRTLSDKLNVLLNKNRCRK